MGSQEVVGASEEDLSEEYPGGMCDPGQEGRGNQEEMHMCSAPST